jgi:hypothetical protein
VGPIGKDQQGSLIRATGNVDRKKDALEGYTSVSSGGRYETASHGDTETAYRRNSTSVRKEVAFSFTVFPL